MGYKYNLGNELAWIKNCKTQDEIFEYIRQLNLNPKYISYNWNKDDFIISFGADWHNQSTEVVISASIKTII